MLKKIEAKELAAVMAALASETNDWIEFTDRLAYQMIELDYATSDILNLEYMGDEYDYIWAQAENFWKTFLNRRVA